MPIHPPVKPAVVDNAGPGTSSAQRRAQIARLIRKRLADGALSAKDRSELDNLIAAELGVSRDQARHDGTRVEPEDEAELA